MFYCLGMFIRTFCVLIWWVCSLSRMDNTFKNKPNMKINLKKFYSKAISDHLSFVELCPSLFLHIFQLLLHDLKTDQPWKSWHVWQLIFNTLFRKNWENIIGQVKFKEYNKVQISNPIHQEVLMAVIGNGWKPNYLCKVFSPFVENDYLYTMCY